MDNNLTIDIVLRNWQHQTKQLINILGKISNEQLLKEVAPGKNTGMYILGHIIAVNDGLLPLFNLGDRMYPELEKTFITTPDKSGQTMPEPDTLRDMCLKGSERITELFLKMDAADWLKRHNAVSEEDFIKEPHRNKLNVLLSRITHQAYHVGQLILLRTQ